MDEILSNTLNIHVDISDVLPFEYSKCLKKVLSERYLKNFALLWVLIKGLVRKDFYKLKKIDGLKGDMF